MIAMLLAGGQGSRLYVLTKDLAKPAVPFGGKYRIIDFPLSNCVNSGIDTVGILTQYEPFELSEYIGNGQPWDLDRMGGGAFVLPPYQRNTGRDWYKGTANAIYQNLRFIERYDPEYVVILSGDHIYKMDYAAMLAEHEKKGAAVTVAALRVPLSEASRFGVIIADEEGYITEFEEKPKNPRSDLASMGIYIFSADKLKKYLTEDEADPESENDFGKNVLPKMLEAGEKMSVYAFEGYWKDVGTVDSLWEAHMDLLDGSDLNLYEKDWRIYSRNPVMPPHMVEEGAKIEDSMVTEGCTVGGEIEKSVLFAGVTVEKGAEVKESIIMPGAVVKSGAKVSRAIIGEKAVIEAEAKVGCSCENAKITLIGPEAVVAEKAEIEPGAIVGKEAAK
ncbi:MAG: glucose-1-phosphate adenylyltransferase [Oscillospiraceae bacterium]|nr:glucose-1-phosphate adenylyltransferase [Oscillospiraceae bacterium]MBR3952773.1 glucose-1-phosphate adenylyltransferase [Oscillospiraceae bacterium]